MSTGKPVLVSHVNFKGKAEFGVRCWRMRVGAQLVVLIIAFALAGFANALDSPKLISQFTPTSWSAKDGIPGLVGAIARTPYYHTVWFRVAALAVFVLLLLALYQIRLVTRHNAELLQENSERKRAEAALKQTRAYMAESERLSLTGSFSWNVGTGEISWSDEVFRIYEWDPSIKPTLERVRQRIHPDDLASCDQTVERAAREMKDFQYGHRIVMPNGSIKHLEMLCHAVKDKSGTVFEYVGAVRDVTERKRAEALLTGEKRLLEMIATGVPLASILDVLCRVIEEQRTGTLASVLLLRPDGLHLDSVAGPSLPKRMDAANGKSAHRSLCRLVWDGGISGIGGHRLRPCDRSTLGRAGASCFSLKTWAASFLVESSAFVGRKGSGNLLHVLSRTPKSELARPRADRVSDTPRPSGD